MRIATLDIGSNTSLLLIADVYKDNLKDPKILEDKIFFTRLAQDFLKTKIITDISLKRQEDFFKKARQIIDKYKVTQVRSVATAVARTAKNKQQLLKIGKQYGFYIDIISGEIEAKISRKGALFKLSVEDISAVVLDIGGASTEISTNNKFFSLPIGSVNLTQEFINSDPPTEQQIHLLQKKIIKEINLIPFCFPHNSILVATAGTPTTLMGLEHKTDVLNNLHGRSLNTKQVQYWFKYLFNLSLKKRQNLKGMPFYRADVMPSGLSILTQIMHKFSYNSCIVSTTGLRYGLLFDNIYNN